MIDSDKIVPMLRSCTILRSCPSNDMILQMIADEVERMQTENRHLQMEIEKLNKENENLLRQLCRKVNKESKAIEKLIKTEAYKEFYDRIEKSILPQLSSSTLEKKDAYYFCLNEIDNILKEISSDN